MTPFELAYLNLLRRPLTSLIAVFAIALSLGCAGVLYRINELSANRFATIGQAGEALVGAKAGGLDIYLGALNGEGEKAGYLPYRLFESLRAEAPVHFEDGVDVKPSFLRGITPLLYFAKYGEYSIVGTDESFLKRPAPASSLNLSEGKWATQPGEVVIGQTVARSGLKVGDSFSVTSESRRADLHVVGILASTNSTWDHLLYTSVTTAQALLPESSLQSKSIWNRDVLNYFLVYLNENGFEALSKLVNSRTVGEAVLVSEQRARLEELTGTGRKLGVFVTLLVLILGGLVVASTLTSRFEALSSQVAALRAIGYGKWSMLQWLLCEGVLLAIAACIIGIPLDGVAFPIVRSLLGSALPPSDFVQVSLLTSYPIWLAAIGATILSVCIPMFRIYRQNIHLALRN